MNKRKYSHHQNDFSQIMLGKYQTKYIIKGDVFFTPNH